MSMVALAKAFVIYLFIPYLLRLELLFIFLPDAKNLYMFGFIYFFLIEYPYTAPFSSSFIDHHVL